MGNTKVVLMFSFVIAFSSAGGCQSDHASVVQPGGSQPTLEETAQYEREKQEMISARD